MKRRHKEEQDNYLTEREAMVMRCIWDKGEEISSLEIQQKLQEETGLQFERTTIATYLLHLQEKNFIEREKKGQVYYYRPLKEKNQYVQNEVRKTTEQWFAGSLPDLVAAFVQSGAEISPEELQKVKELIDGLDQ